MKVSTDLNLRPDLFEARGRRERESIAASLAEADARPVTVGMFQMRNHCGGQAGKARNLERMLDAMRVGHAHGVTVMAMPEMCLPGYFTPVSGSVAQAIADTHALTDVVGESDALAQLMAAARTYAMVLAFGFAERDGEAVYNSIGLVDADGAWLGTRRKNPLYPWDFELKPFTEPEPAYRSAVFDTAVGRIALANCFDGEFPESVRQMRCEGAELLLWCNAPCGDPAAGTSSRFVEAGGHARANAMWIACCCCVADNTTGSSIAFAPSGEPLVLLSPDEEELGIAVMNLARATSWPMRRPRLCAQVQPQPHLRNAAPGNV